MYSADEKRKFQAARADMVRYQLTARDITDPDVLRVAGRIPREEFMPPKYASEAYADYPVPIGMGQTISQPYIVALMTQTLKPDKNCDVLEIGTGSGYQTALLANLFRRVFTIERHHQLLESAQANLARLGIENIEYYIGDGSAGWPQPRTFQRILITAAVPQPPQPLIDQLAENGLLVAPVGGPYLQKLCRYTKTAGQLKKQTICGCRFVKLLGKYGFSEP